MIHENRNLASFIYTGLNSFSVSHCFSLFLMIFVRTTIIENGVTEATGFFFSMHLGISLNLGYLRKSQRSPTGAKACHQGQNLSLKTALKPIKEPPTAPVFGTELGR
jgi:hypothetical protein